MLASMLTKMIKRLRPSSSGEVALKSVNNGALSIIPNAEEAVLARPGPYSWLTISPRLNPIAADVSSMKNAINST